MIILLASAEWQSKPDAKFNRDVEACSADDSSGRRSRDDDQGQRRIMAKRRRVTAMPGLCIGTHYRQEMTKCPLASSVYSTPSEATTAHEYRHSLISSLSFRAPADD